MVYVKFLGPIKEETFEVEASNLEGLRQILHEKQNLHSWLSVSAIAINGELIEDIHTPLRAGDEVVFLPPVCGG
ncbi:MoaD/ThiS family protein [Helicobacter suis]|uniref:MoaD/ThiS family protein n=1 Tax=Helicobacter suis TaxID=104628 RepID=UPI000CF103B4|nr:MoaD/ThiS family protein [Helicobacter suis]